MKKSYSIGDVSRQTGITEKQLRYWEVRGYIPKPEKMLSGKRYLRRYTEYQLQFIKTIKSYLDKGYTLSAAIGFARNEKERRGINYEKIQ